MHRQIRPVAVAPVLVFSLVCASFYLSLFRSVNKSRISPVGSLSTQKKPSLASTNNVFFNSRISIPSTPHLSPPATFSVLFPEWEVLVVPTSPPPPWEGYFCHFQDGSVSPAKTAVSISHAGGNITTFKCRMPPSVRRLRPFFSPVLADSAEKATEMTAVLSEMARWSFLAYESFSTEEDVVLFVKGINSRQGRNIPDEEIRCVYSNGVTAPVRTSAQEVFRCPHPPATSGEELKISLMIEGGESPVPSVAYYSPPSRRSENAATRSLLCACTMVRDAGKYLREWVIYHSEIGVDKFVLYDNGSQDDIEEVVKKLVENGYNVTRVMWAWEKTQEAGFSHCAISYKDSCAWMMFIDVDEFVFSPSWANISTPSKFMLPSLLPNKSSVSDNSLLSPSSSSSSSSSSFLSLLPSSLLFSTSELSISRPIGQVSMRCYEFGPSNRSSHPKKGVTQGYTCRRLIEERHKSIVSLDAIDNSLLNVVHHFELKRGFGSKKLAKEDGVVNHYKYQAWPEFKKKFRRRVSAYVVDWQSSDNPASKDRTPGLGFTPVEPKGWASKFCEVNDTRLKEVGARWFGEAEPPRDKMKWQE